MYSLSAAFNVDGLFVTRVEMTGELFFVCFFPDINMVSFTHTLHDMCRRVNHNSAGIGKENQNVLKWQNNRVYFVLLQVCR